MNIVTGQVVNHASVDVDKAQLLGKTQMESFECSWPGGFHDSIPRIVTIMALSRKHSRRLRDAKTKSNLKNARKVEVSRRLAEQDVQATFLGGCAVL